MLRKHNIENPTTESTMVSMFSNENESLEQRLLAFFELYAHSLALVSFIYHDNIRDLFRVANFPNKIYLQEFLDFDFDHCLAFFRNLSLFWLICYGWQVVASDILVHDKFSTEPHAKTIKLFLRKKLRMKITFA